VITVVNCQFHISAANVALGGHKMGKVAVSMRVMPTSEEVNIDEMLKSIKILIKGEYSLGNSQVEEVAFGLKAIRLIIVMDDKEGLMDNIENEIRKIDGVSEVEVEEVSLIS